MLLREEVRSNIHLSFVCVLYVFKFLNASTCFLGLCLLFHSTDFSVVICGIQIYGFLTDSCFSDSCFVLTSMCWEWWDFLTMDVSGNRLPAVCSLTIPYNYFILAPLPRGQYLVPTDPPTALSDYFVM